MDPEKSPMAFVIGTGRSGTTLLRLMLSAHPRVYLTQEAHFFYEAFLRNATRRQYLEFYLKTPSFRWLGLDPAPSWRARQTCSRASA